MDGPVRRSGGVLGEVPYGVKRKGYSDFWEVSDGDVCGKESGLPFPFLPHGDDSRVRHVTGESSAGCRGAEPTRFWVLQGRGPPGFDEVGDVGDVRPTHTRTYTRAHSRTCPHTYPHNNTRVHTHT